MLSVQLVRQAITSAAQESYVTNTASLDPGSHGDGPSFELTIPGIHLVYSSVQQRLQLFGEAVQLWPDCVVKLDKLTKNPDSNFTENEMVCILNILCDTFM